MDRGRNATIKIWSARRASPHPQDQVSSRFRRRRPKIFINDLVNPWIPRTKGVDHCRPGLCVDFYNPEANGGNPKRWRGMPNIPKLTQYVNSPPDLTSFLRNRIDARATVHPNRRCRPRSCPRHCVGIGRRSGLNCPKGFVNLPLI
jgi:hypothetical protein